MKFLVDECCEAEIVTLLRSEGHDILYAPEYKPGSTDEELLVKAFKEERILITEDKDFGQLVYRLKRPARGIILLRFDPGQRDLKWIRLRDLISKFGLKLSGRLVTVDSERYRFRLL